MHRVKHWQSTQAMFAALSVSLALADDFKTINGKEYKDATVSRVEPDGIIVKTKSGISKVYFTELPKEVQEQFHYDPVQAAAAQAAAAQAYAAQQTGQLNKQLRDASAAERKHQTEQQGKQRNISPSRARIS